MPFHLSPTSKSIPERRWLDFDIEARPLSWIGGDYVSREVTAICARFLNQRKYHVWVMGEVKPREMLQGFRELYDQADVVTGHYIRGYDLPNLNGAYVELGLDPLGPKLSLCTKEDLVKLQGVSKSQESLADILGVKHPKIVMTQQDWREANRLTLEGLKKTRRRVQGDVRQHIAMLRILKERNLVGRPKLWDPQTHRAGRYQP